MAAVAAEDAVVVVVVSAPPAPAPAPCRLATALDYMVLASLWVTCASTAAVAVAGRVSGTDSPVSQALQLTVQGALLLFVLAVVAWCLHDLATGLRLLKALVADAVVKNKKVPGAVYREKQTDVLRRHALALFGLLQIVGLLIRVVPGEECHRIGAALFDLGTVGFTAICCFLTVPWAALLLRKNKDWRSSVIAISEGNGDSSII
ncbi:hypothetical protein EJB05_49066 [Eragrostis curvula]|uniref:Uncharacterized protein n=1 Tax=Eragrostis curvula TaxID=38414 RepID=A0A5J9T3J9_9POAL|nr:hypothetical protein EJB05_49066 [Eragrostis curvula]